MLLHYIYSLQEREREVHLHQARETDDFFLSNVFPLIKLQTFSTLTRVDKVLLMPFSPEHNPLQLSAKQSEAD